MFELVYRVRVEWRHCDPCRIVYNPHFFDWMDVATQRVFEEAGMNFARMMDEDPGFRTTPLIKDDTVFKGTARMGDVLEIRTKITRWGNTSFTITHRFFKEGEEIIASEQVRVWAREHDDDPARIKSVRVPDEVRAALSAPKTSRVGFTD